MSKLWKVATFPTVGDLAKEIGNKKRLTIELRNSIRTFQSEYVGKGDIVYGGDAISNVCTTLEAIFIHGLKGKFSARMSSVFGGATDVKIPEPDFWSVIMKCSHKDVLSRISGMRQITTDVGRSRAWLRVAINDGLICSYLDTMIADKRTLQNFYTSVAYLRDHEQPDIMKQLLDGISVFSFQLPCNTSTLNVWSSTPLVLAGVWTPPALPQPVMPAVDVIEFFNEQGTENCEVMQDISVDNSSFATVVNSTECTKDSPCLAENGVKAELGDGNIEGNIGNGVDSSDMGEIAFVSESEGHGEDKQNDASDVSSSCSIPDINQEAMNIMILNNKTVGNRLWIESGWSSEFESNNGTLSESAIEEHDQESYDSLLHSYNKNRPVIVGVVGTPDLTEIMPENIPVIEEEKTDSECTSIESKSCISDFEVIPKSTLLSSKDSNERTQYLLSVIGKISPEQGLDSQDYECQGCGCPIGMIYGKAHLCQYDGFSYCGDCHNNETCCIPARIIHNWDFKKYPVAKYTKIFLSMIEQEPILDMKVLNPLIYTAVEEMAELQTLRTQLTFLRSYIFTCKESVVEELRKKVWPREYLYEHVHLYSLCDLLQCMSGSLQQTLQKCITFAKKHVLSCQLCKSKAFICEMCNNPKVLYPFDTDIAYHCDQCLAVYHRSCMETKKFCPKCERRRKRKEMSDSSSWCAD